MLADRQARHTHATLNWTLIVLALGALLGIGVAAYLSRQDRPLPEDPDAPLFI